MNIAYIDPTASLVTFLFIINIGSHTTLARQLEVTVGSAKCLNLLLTPNDSVLQKICWYIVFLQSLVSCLVNSVSSDFHLLNWNLEIKSNSSCCWRNWVKYYYCNYIFDYSNHRFHVCHTVPFLIPDYVKNSQYGCNRVPTISPGLPPIKRAWQNNGMFKLRRFSKISWSSYDFLKNYFSSLCS
jgi:hypothetical protein